MEFVKTIPPEYKDWDMGDKDVTEEALVQSQLLLHDEEYTQTDEMNVVVCSWNINQKKPEDEAKLREWMRIDKCDSAIIAVGLQELDMSTHALLREETDVSKPWIQSLKQAAQGYDTVATRQLAGLLIVVLVRQDLSQHIDSIATAVTRCGAMANTVANKGSVAIRFQLHQTTFCFATAHLAAHQAEVEKRNRDFSRIVEVQNFKVDSQDTLMMKDHDRVFFFGDLNYRIDLPYSEALFLVEKGDWDVLLAEDQLTRQMSSGGFTFHNFSDVPPSFAPTYKFDTGTHTYDTSEKRRTPAWTDRIMWWTPERDEEASSGTPPPAVVPITFENNVAMLSSDHRAVVGVMSVSVRRVVPEVKKRIRGEIQAKIRHLGADRFAVPNVSLSESCIDFGQVVYGGHHVSREIELTNKGHSMVLITVSSYNNILSSSSSPKSSGAVISDPEDRRNCIHSPNWLSVRPVTVRLGPGQKHCVSLTCCIDKAAVADAATERFGPFRNPEGSPITLSHWLVFSAGPQRFWVEATAQYTPSSFGSTLMSLTCLGLIPIAEAYAMGRDQQPPPPPKPQVPKELWWMVDYLARFGKHTPQLFLTGTSDLSPEVFQKVREWLDTKCEPFPEGFVDPSAMSQVLLVFLSDLQEPVIPTRFYDRIQATNAPIAPSSLPAPHFNSLVYIISFLKFLIRPENQKHNKLTSELLAQGFASVLLQRDPFATPCSTEQEDQERLRSVNYITQLISEP